jgi:hypothetical protein
VASRNECVPNFAGATLPANLAPIEPSVLPLGQFGRSIFAVGNADTEQLSKGHPDGSKNDAAPISLILLRDRG